jgi:AcrR family transcriptional regulator
MAPRASAKRGPPAGARKRSARTREDALAEQRLRLIGAMIRSVQLKGYRATTVGDVIAIAGVSRKTFYKHFANKQSCFIAAYDLVSERAIGRLTRAGEEAGGWPERVEAAIGALFEAAIENPGALRLALVEIGALGPAGIGRRERSVAAYERFILDAVKLAPGKGAMSEMTVKAVVGGVMRVLGRRVFRGERAELLALVPDLVAWFSSYYPTPPGILRQPARRAGSGRGAVPALQGGRAPGTLAPHAPLGTRRGLPRGDQNVSRSYVVHSQRERILDAVANLAAAEGYAALKVEDIAAEAAVSLNAFYEHFADIEDAFLVAYEVGHGKSLAIVERAYVAESDWRLGVRAGIAALFEFMAEEPAFAHMALLDALVASSRSAERSNLGVDAYAQMLVPGLDQAPRDGGPPAVTVEAVAGGLFELCLHYAVHGRIRELPDLTVGATYIALAPFIGSEHATRIATAA